MDYSEKIKLAIDYIERNLHKNITLTQISNKIGISKFYFHRLFKNMFNLSVTEYIRKRRLSIAAEKLLTSNYRVIDVAFDAKYNSQAAFSRSFKKAFGINPTELNNYSTEIDFFQKVDIENYAYRDFNIEQNIEIEIIELNEIKLVGLEMTTTSVNLQFYTDHAYQWITVEKNKHKIDNIIAKTDESYSITEFKYGEKESLIFTGLQVSKFENVSENMVKRTIPKGIYAKAIHKGQYLWHAHKTLDYLYFGWLPNSGYQLNYNKNNYIAIDHYTDKTTHLDNSETEILIPIKKNK